jgi:hypothetical protein
VLFANDVRKNLRDKQLSFTQIARQVGKSWQLAGNAELSEWKLQAASMRELYLQDLEKYKQTKEYKEYRRYLFDFKITSSSPHPRSRRQHASSSTDADGKVSGTRRHGSSCPNLSAYPNLQTQHYIKPEATACQTRPPAPHGTQSVYCILPGGPPPGSMPQPFLKILHISSSFLPRR